MRKTHILAVFLLCCFSSNLLAQDHFAEIATRLYEDRSSLLIEHKPNALPEKYLPTESKKSAAFKAINKLDTPEELKAELQKEREKYAPFLKEVAPDITRKRERLYLKEFQWREGTYRDPSDLKKAMNQEGTWKTVTIPHFGPPLGRAVTFYSKEIDSSELPTSDERTYLCFRGVDYKATIYLNGIFVGTHEGFFAPFEFDITKFILKGRNTLLVQVENDFTTTGSTNYKDIKRAVGDKIYAATGLGYDDSMAGWHHCPPGMGINQHCYFEGRSSLHINDVFVRPMLKDKKAEAWIEINNKFETFQDVKLKISVYGLNFDQTIIKDMEYTPQSVIVPGIGDLVKPTDNKGINLPMGYESNFMRVDVPMDNFRTWDLEAPWMYQMQVKVLNSEGKLVDEYKQNFGMRSFHMDTTSTPKGMMYLNDRPIRLRGANTMGHEQQCVFKGDFDQLVDDILLAKICNMNFLRLTQRPVQSEVYDYCDKLGLMIQMDLPLFGGLRRPQLAEAFKQVEAMERLGRSHPCIIVDTYINERFPNAEGSPQRSFSARLEYERIFSAFDQAVLLSNPDRVIKAGDGDYDPPSPGLPDNHCYNGWYNGHGLGLGQMYKGYWMPVKPGWYYGCGEFGSEGLDPKSVMYKYYPKEWLPQNAAEDKTWRASVISQAQTHNFHYMWYPTQHSVQDWIDASQEHQRWVTKLTAETFRRDNRMVTFAVHLFIDAWPAGWMKTIMDVDRQPKKAYFAYREALSPLMVSLRSDRDKFYSGEKIKIEAWLSNDMPKEISNYSIRYQLEQNGKPLFANSQQAIIESNLSTFQGYIAFDAPKVSSRKDYTLRIQVCDEKGNVINENDMFVEIFPVIKKAAKKVYLAEDNNPIKEDLIYIGAEITKDISQADVIIMSDYETYNNQISILNAEVEKGKKILFMEIKPGEYDLLGKKVLIAPTVMGKYYFANPRTDHPMMKNYKDFDFKCWYNPAEGYFTPLLYNTIIAPDLTTVVATGTTTWTEAATSMGAVSELEHGKGAFRICEITLAGRTKTNPTAALFLNDLISK